MSEVLFYPIRDLYYIGKAKGDEGKKPYIEIGNINILNKEYKYTNKKSVKGCKIANKTDVIVSRVRPTRGAIALIKDDSITVSSAFTIIKNIEMADKYLFYYLSENEKFYNYLGENCTGTMYPTVSEDIILNSTLPIYPLNEQKRIVAKLDAIIPRIDSVKARLERIPVIIKRFRQSVLTAAVTGKLTEKWREEHPEQVPQDMISFLEIEKYKNEWNDYDLPTNWKCVFLRDIADVRLGKMLDGNKNKGELTKYLRNVNVRWFSFDLSDLNEIKISPDEKKKLTIENGDVFICEGGEPGRAAVWKSGTVDMTFQKALHRVRFSIPLISDWLVYNLKVDADSQKLNDLFTGSTIKHFTGRSLALYPIPLPPLEEQKEIVRQVDKLFAFADKLEAHYQKAKARIDKLSQSVLAKAFRGELVPQDPDDEPAEKLLERIMAEKTKMMGGGRQKTGGRTRKAKV